MARGSKSLKSLFFVCRVLKMTIFKIKSIFTKKGLMRYISHLDFIRLIYRALRRADLPFVLTEGFNPRPKVKFSQALKLGSEGTMDVIFFLKDNIDPESFRQKIEQQLNKDVKVVDIRYG